MNNSHKETIKNLIDELGFYEFFELIEEIQEEENDPISIHVLTTNDIMNQAAEGDEDKQGVIEDLWKADKDFIQDMKEIFNAVRESSNLITELEESATFAYTDKPFYNKVEETFS